jgi:hypothetical protein
MSTSRDHDAVIGAWLDDGPGELPAETRQAITVGIRTVARRRAGLAWPFARHDLRTIASRRLPAALGSAVVVVVAAGLALSFAGNLWGPSETEGPSATPTSSNAMWPQSTLDEVRQAQQLADAGDPGYTWQLRVDGGQVGQHHPCSGASSGCWSRARNGGSGEIFIRFLEEELGWEEYFWDEALSHSGRDDLNPGDVVFVRCAAGLANPLYPTDSGRPDCAPTIDELRYETVKINVAQPDRQGPTGIWVVTGWEMVEPATQVAPPSDAEITAFLEPFLQARIDGEGAEDFAEFKEDDGNADQPVEPIPLLYATSSGAPYERSEFEVVDVPLWPEGWLQLKVRLFAENDDAVVEQVFELGRDETGLLRLVYDPVPMGPAGPYPATTENGKAAPVEYAFLDGLVTYRAAYPLEPRQDEFRELDGLTIEGLLPDDDAPRRILLFMADPRPPGQGCGDAPAPTDAEALARILEADPDFEATAPVAMTIGGLSGLRMDGVVASATACGFSLRPAGGRARLYLLDLPGGSVRVLGIAVSADEDSFETVLERAEPVIHSVEFHAP